MIFTCKLSCNLPLGNLWAFIFYFHHHIIKMKTKTQRKTFKGKGLYSTFPDKVHTHAVKELYLTTAKRREMENFLTKVKKEFPLSHDSSNDGVAEVVAEFFDSKYKNVPQTFDGFNTETNDVVDVKWSDNVFTEAQIQKLKTNPGWDNILKGASTKQVAMIKYLQNQNVNCYFLKLFRDDRGRIRCLKYYDKFHHPARGAHKTTAFRMASAGSAYGLYKAAIKRSFKRPQQYSRNWYTKLPASHK